jgi:lysozyme
MTLSPLGLALIQFFENYADRPYRRFPHEPWTAGWGHTGADVTQDTVVTPEIALKWLKEDTLGAETVVMHDVKVKLYQHEFDALVSLVYNAGQVALEHRTGEVWVVSTLLKQLNASNISAAAEEFLQWDHLNGVPDKGLLRRRQLEKALFLDGAPT